MFFWQQLPGAAELLLTTPVTGDSAVADTASVLITAGEVGASAVLLPIPTSFIGGVASVVTTIGGRITVIGGS